MQDRNGNQITVTETGWRDSLGRIVQGSPPGTGSNGVFGELEWATEYLLPGVRTTDLSSCPTGTAWARLWTLPTPPGATTAPKITFCLSTFTVQSAFNLPGVADNAWQAELLTRVILPDGTTFAFEYNNYGDITKITFPAGGSISYEWATLQECGASFGGNRFVTSRSVDANDGSGPKKWLFTYDTSNLFGGRQTTVKDPLNNETVHTFTSFDPSSLDAGCALYETKSEQYQGLKSANVLLRTVDTRYDLGVINPFWTAYAIQPRMMNMVPTQKTDTLSNGLVSKTAYSYDLGEPFTFVPIIAGSSGPVAGPPQTFTFLHGNQTQVQVFDYGQGSPGNLLQSTTTTFQWQVDANYKTANLLDLTASTTKTDAAGHICSETDISYDDPGYLTTPTSPITTQHGSPIGPVRGNPTIVKRKLTNSPCTANAGWSDVISHINWYDTGEVYKEIDPLNHVTTSSYDSAYVGSRSTQVCLPQTGSISHCISGTYDFNTSLRTSSTNENALVQASGNTPGDAAHTHFYGYDLMSRFTSSVAPPDPANGNVQYATSFNLSAPGVLPIIVQQLTSITGSSNDSVTTTYDGLGRPVTKERLVPDPTGAMVKVTVKMSYDGVGHLTDVTNPYISLTDPTAGTTHTDFDALDRPFRVIRQDGGTNTTTYDISAPGARGNCRITTDEANMMRRLCMDALDRVVEVGEPGAGVNDPGMPASGSSTITGSLQSSTTSGTKATGWFTVNGTDNGVQTWICNDTCVRGPFVWDSGQVNVTVNGVTYSTPYGRTSTANSIAAALYAQFTGSPASATNPGTGATSNLTADQPGPNYSLSWSSQTNDPTDFSGPSFLVTLSGSTLTGGANPTATYDSGTLAVTVDGFQASAAYSQNQNSTPAALASALASALNGPSSPVTASANGATISLTAKSVGTATNYSVTGGSSASFTASSATLSGGTDPGGIYTPLVTLYTYDTLGNLLRVEQHGGTTDSTQWRVRTFTYNSLSQLLTAINPESGTISYVYDADGELLQKTSPAPNQTGTATQTVSYCYDELHRVTGRGYGAQSCPLSSPVVTYAYDSGGNAKGQLVSMTDQTGLATYTYDALSRLSSEQRTIAGVAKTVAYEYNLNGSLRTLHYPSGASVTYTVDAAGRVASVTDMGNGINYVTGATYAPDGSVGKYVNGNTSAFSGITNLFTYNKRLQPVSISATTPTQTVLSLTYDFHVSNGNNGNVWGIANGRDPSRNQSFTFDALNRLASAQNAGTDCTINILGNNKKFWGNTYTHDAWGNLLNKTKISTACAGENLSAVALPNNQLSGFTYDISGNMIRDAVHSYGFDQENRLSVVDFTIPACPPPPPPSDPPLNPPPCPQPTFTASYVYDGDGDRVEKSNGTTGTLYWYGAPGVLAETDLTGAIKSEYIFLGSSRVARRDGPGGAGGVFYYLSDHLKTASVVTDSTGNIKAESDYYPWGGELQFISSDSNDYKFTGKKRDLETGLDYFGARYYSSSLGRFLSPDWSSKPVPVPYADLMNPQSLNLYKYSSNPETIADLNGHEDYACGFWCKASNYYNYGVWGSDFDVAIAVAKQRAELKTRQEERIKAGLLPLLLDSGMSTEDGRPILTSNIDLMSSSAVMSSDSSKKHWDKIAAFGLGYVYIASEKHIRLGNEPKNGQAALNNSAQVKDTSPRRVGADFENNELVVLDRTVMVTPESESEYHGHVRNWDEMTDNMRNSFIKNGLTDKRGNIINPQLRIPLNGTAKGESGEEER